MGVQLREDRVDDLRASAHTRRSVSADRRPREQAREGGKGGGERETHRVQLRRAVLAALAAPFAEQGPALSPESPLQSTISRQLQTGVYRCTSFEPERALLQPDQFFESTYSALLAELIAKVVKQEGPIKDDVLVERIARAHGFLRSGNRIRERVLALTRLAHFLRPEENGATTA